MQRFLRQYRSAFRPYLDAENAWFAGQPSLALAISLAGLARDSGGKRLPHSNRLRSEQLQNAEAVLLSAQSSIARCRSFDDLIRIVSSSLKSIWRNPELFAYDTALRIGAKLGLTPQKVYLHRGTRAGARALGLDTRAGFLTMDQLPTVLQVLEPREVEDFLCIFKDKFVWASDAKPVATLTACAAKRAARRST